jgi:hypothetical protein
MCTYSTERARIEGAGKGAEGWFSLTDVLAYVDHPFHSQAEHTLNLDFINDQGGASARVAVELTVDSARALLSCIEEALEAAGALAAG